MPSNKYVLITPARNEASYIEKTINAVIAQTVLPQKWVVVSDGSTDGTDETVKRYTNEHPFIQLIHISDKERRDFSSKVFAINEGYKRLSGIYYDYLGNLDADISFDKYYYENILNEFHNNSKLGIAGGTRLDVYDGNIHEIVRSRNSVMGAIQFFRRQCYEDISGYIPLKNGGIDAVAEIMARMHGWQVKTVPEIKVCHYRRTGTADKSFLKAAFVLGQNDYLIGYHPLFELFRFFHRIPSRPYFFEALFLFCGYCCASIKRPKREVPDNMVKYLRSEQISRLQALIFSRKRIKDELAI